MGHLDVQNVVQQQVQIVVFVRYVEKPWILNAPNVEQPGASYIITHFVLPVEQKLKVSDKISQKLSRKNYFDLKEAANCKCNVSEKIFYKKRRNKKWQSLCMN